MSLEDRWGYFCNSDISTRYSAGLVNAVHFNLKTELLYHHLKLTAKKFKSKSPLCKWHEGWRFCMAVIGSAEPVPLDIFYLLFHQGVWAPSTPVSWRKRCRRQFCCHRPNPGTGSTGLQGTNSRKKQVSWPDLLLIPNFYWLLIMVCIEVSFSYKKLNSIW